MPLAMGRVIAIMAKLNCWEFKQCGREPGGARVTEEGTCPVGLPCPLDSVHGGRNAGRACWVVAGSLCGGQVQGSFASKYASCKECDFYKAVRNEEFPSFKLSATLLAMLRG